MPAISYADIEPINPEWTWEGRIHGATLLAGDGGIGKGMLIADLASRITRGLPMPDGSPGPPIGSVILVTPEDDPNMSVVHRLTAVGADLSRVHDMTDEFVVPDSIPALRETIDALGDVRLVVVDPLSDVAGIPLTSSNVRVRRLIMNPLRRLAADTGAAVLMVHHTVKSGRVGGTKGITDAARMVLRVSRLASDERVRIVHVDKTNIASDSASDVAYTIRGTFPDVAVEWLDVPDAGVLPVRQLSTPERVFALLQAAGIPVATQEIAHSLEVPYGTVRVALSRLKREDKIWNPERGQWAIVPALLGR